jgi:kinesin family protein 2/24
MATFLAYGQAGSGNTHTMGGEIQGKTQVCKKEIYAMATEDVFNFFKASEYKDLNLRLSASFFDIYSNDVVCYSRVIRSTNFGSWKSSRDCQPDG